MNLSFKMGVRVGEGLYRARDKRTYYADKRRKDEFSKKTKTNKPTTFTT